MRDALLVIFFSLVTISIGAVLQLSTLSFVPGALGLIVGSYLVSAVRRSE